MSTGQVADTHTVFAIHSAGQRSNINSIRRIRKRQEHRNRCIFQFVSVNTNDTWHSRQRSRWSTVFLVNETQPHGIRALKHPAAEKLLD